MLYPKWRRYLGLFVLTTVLVTLVHSVSTGLWLYPSYWWTSRLQMPGSDMLLYLLFVLAPLPAVAGSIVLLRLWRYTPTILLAALLAQLLLKLIDEGSGFAPGRALVHDTAQWLLLAAVYGSVTALGAVAGLMLGDARKPRAASRIRQERMPINGD